MRTSLLAPLLAASLLAGSSETALAADPPAQAQQDFDKAMQMFQRGDIEHACDLFAQSYNEQKQPGTLFNLSVCREKQGRYADAYRGFDELATAAEAALLTDKAAAARARANALLPKLARIDLVHRKDALSDVASITLDTTTTLPAEAYKKPVYVLPGAHTIDIKHADGTDVVRKSDNLAAGATQTIEMEDPAPLPDTPLGPNASAPLVLREQTTVNKKQRTAAFIIGGVGAGLLVGGTVFGILAIKKRSSAEDECNPSAPGKICTSTDRATQAGVIRDQGKTFATVSDIGFIAGAAAAAGAVYLYVTATHKTVDSDSAPAAASRESTSKGWQLVPTGDAHGGGASLFARF